MKTRTVDGGVALLGGDGGDPAGSALHDAGASRETGPRRGHRRAAPAAEAPQLPVRGGALGLETFRDVARAANPGVVNISTSKVVRLRSRDPFHDFGDGNDFLERFFGLGPQNEGGGREQRQTQTSLGSGFVIDRDGYILTNRHVIEGADQVSVSFPGDKGKRHEAKIVGQDARTDVALIKIERERLAHAAAARRLRQARGRRVGDGRRQPVRPRRQQRDGRRRLLHGPRHPARGAGERHLRAR